ncbi:hypothetical protein IH981_03950 [Patescibacteria group bacterium]|nr:hypothetical protein [Patescibacteria group bacterium]
MKEGYSESKPLDDFWGYGTAEETVDEVLEHLIELARIFNNALEKMDQRRVSLQERSTKLDDAIAPFRRE